jgi:hypothetical protein
MADGPMGTIWSSSPWMIRVGISDLRRSSVKSVSEKAAYASSHLKITTKISFGTSYNLLPVDVTTDEGKATINNDILELRLKKLQIAPEKSPHR